MAKKKKKRHKKKKTAPVPAPVSGPPRKPIGKIVVRGGLAAMAVGVVVYIWQSNQAVTAFEEIAVTGKPKLSAVITERNDGGGHPGFLAPYAARFPTSGQHNSRWIDPGFHQTPQNAGKLVHALEHGNIVIYYDAPGAETLALLKQWSSMFKGQWSGVVVTPAPGFGEEVILTAWRKKLRLKPFVESTAAAFIDSFRGRGPENPIR